MANAINFLVGYLTDNWNAANTDGRTPTIGLITDFKRKDPRDGGYLDGDTILIYKASGTAKGRGYSGIDYTDRVTIDCRSVWFSDSVTWQDHGQKIEDEVLRIIEGKKSRPAGDEIWDALDPAANQDLDDKGRRLAKRVIDVIMLRSKEVTEI